MHFSAAKGFWETVRNETQEGIRREASDFVSHAHVHKRVSVYSIDLGRIDSERRGMIVCMYASVVFPRKTQPRTAGGGASVSGVRPTSIFAAISTTIMGALALQWLGLPS